MTDLTYHQLISDHDRIESIADTILAMAAEPTPDTHAIATRLSELAIVVADHIGQEDALLYTRLAREGGDRESASIADELELLKRDWLEYLREWPEDSIAADMPTFSQETADVLKRLKSRVRRESDLLYAGALQQGRIRLR